MAPKFTVGQLVWAKMKGFPYWPSKIAEATKEVKRSSVKKPSQWVFFFGTNNFAWVINEWIKPYDEFKDVFLKKNSKSGNWKEAVEAINEYIEGGGDQDDKDEYVSSVASKSSRDRKRATSGSSNSSNVPGTSHSGSLAGGRIKKSKKKRVSGAGGSPSRSSSSLMDKPSTSSAFHSTLLHPLHPHHPHQTENHSVEGSMDDQDDQDEDNRELGGGAPSSSSPGGLVPLDDHHGGATEGSHLGHKADGGRASSASTSKTGAAGLGVGGGSRSPTHSHNSSSSLAAAAGLVQRRSASPAAVSSSRYNSTSSVSHHKTNANSASSGLLMRPTYVSRPATPPLDVEKVSEMLKEKKVVASDLKFGFLGLGIMGQGIVKNLLNSGHKVIVWNRTPSKCRDFVKAGATKGQTPADVIVAADITFCCVSDPVAAKEMVFGNCGVLQEIGNSKGYVEMTSIDPETSQDIAEAIMARNGRYLEAPVSGSKKSAEEGLLIVLAAGDRSLFSDCTTCFQAMGKHAFYLGDIGNGCKMNLTLNMLLGSTLSSLAEAMALADRAGLSQRDLVEILELGDLNCAAIVEKGQAIIEGTFPTSMPLQHMQKDLRLALGVGDQLEQPLPMAASACEVFKHAKRMGYSEHDVSAVYIRARF